MIKNISQKRIIELILIFLPIFCLLGNSTKVFSETYAPQPKVGIELQVVGKIPILYGGRQVPFDTFSRETVRFITGRENYRGFDSVELILSWLTQSYEWEIIPLLKVPYQPLVDHLQMKVSEGGISPKELGANQDFHLFLQTVATKQQEGQDLTEMEKEAGLLRERWNKFYQITQGSSLNLVPRKKEGWESLAQLAERFPKVSLQDANPTLDARLAVGVRGLLAAYHQGDAGLFNQISPVLKNLFRQKGLEAQNYPTESSVNREVHYNRLKPFRWAWVAYTLAFFIILLSIGIKGGWLFRVGIGFMVLAFALHTYGFILRILISGRPPVTNMYETVLWVPFGMVIFAFILTAIFKVRIYLLVASALAALGLILADSSPLILDPAIQPLVPVLRNNYWLTVHVLTITLSYGAFTLAMGVGNVSLGYFIFKTRQQDQIQRLNYFIYRAIQIGVVLLAAGTILGGVWANASWGRFWGWDPKEVWALIALLGYLAILHGRYAGWVKGFGLTVGSVLAYLLVLMAWYGVNFILGAGLHSYGFSSGGAKLVSIFLAIEFIWIALATFQYKFRYKPPSLKPSSS